MSKSSANGGTPQGEVLVEEVAEDIVIEDIPTESETPKEEEKIPRETKTIKESRSIKLGDRIIVSPDGYWQNGQKIPTWVSTKKFLVTKELPKNNYEISLDKKSPPTGVLHAKYLSIAGPYLIKE